MPQPSKVLGADGVASLDLNPDNAAVGGLKYSIYLNLVLGPVVGEVSALLIPAELACQFGQDEVLEHRTSGTVRFTKPSAVLPEQVAGEAGWTGTSRRTLVAVEAAIRASVLFPACLAPLMETTLVSLSASVISSATFRVISSRCAFTSSLWSLGRQMRGLLLAVDRNPSRSVGATRVAPTQATEAVEAVLSGDRDAILAVLSPSLASQLPAELPTPDQLPTSVSLVEWYEQDVFATATAVVQQPSGEARLAVGFRLVDGTWRITFTEVIEQ